MLSRLLWRRACSSSAFGTASPAVSEAVLQSLDTLVPGRTSTSPDVLKQHGTDESYHTPVPPEAVIYPETAEEVSNILRTCNAARVPVVPFGVGTSIEGHVAALHGGISLDTSRMNRIIDIDADNATARVQPGVTRNALNAALRDEGLVFSVDPGADATIGGMAATRASGTTSVRCGTMRENVLAAEVALADGQLMRVGRPVAKSSSGYDLLHLMVGSEGTLGVFTELTVRLWPQPEAVAAAVCTFASMKDLVDCAAAVKQTGAPVSRMEVMDGLTVRAVNMRSKTAFAETPTLIFEFVGSQAGVDEAAAGAQELASSFGGSDFRWSSTPEGRAELWAARHGAYWASLALVPGASAFATDVCVPISRLADSVMHAQDAVQRHDITAPMVGHVGDGNFHMVLLVDPEDAEQISRSKAVVDEIVQFALDAGGTCTGEHGLGHGKLHSALQEHGPVVIDCMHAIKTALDPNHILNPGKVGSPLEVFSQPRRR